MPEFEEQVLKEVLKKYDRTEESWLEDLTTLKEWMMTQPHLPEVLSSKKLQYFLLTSKCSIEKAKEKIDNYCTTMSKIANELLLPTSPQIQDSFDIEYLVTLPKLTREKYKVWIYKIRNKDRINEIEPITVLNRGLHIQEITLSKDYSLGDIFIVDCEGVSFDVVIKLTPSILTKMIVWSEKIYALPLKGVYIINSISFLKNILKILKTVMKPKLFQRIDVCADTSLLENVFEKDMIPSDYGGNGPSLEQIQNTLKEKLSEYQNQFAQLLSLQVDENLRPVKPKNDEVLGYYGNFKRLSID